MATHRQEQLFPWCRRTRPLIDTYFHFSATITIRCHHRKNPQSTPQLTKKAVDNDPKFIYEIRTVFLQHITDFLKHETLLFIGKVTSSRASFPFPKLHDCQGGTFLQRDETETSSEAAALVFGFTNIIL